jgi:hypothetical protein
MKYFGDFIFWLFLAGIMVILIRDQSNAVALMKGTVGAGIDLSSGIANLGGPGPSSYQAA